MRYKLILLAIFATSLGLAQTETTTTETTTTEQSKPKEETPAVNRVQQNQSVQTPPARVQNYSQQNRTSRVNNSAVEEEDDAPNTIENQIERLINKSGNYQAYKVIEKAKILLLQRNILDTLKSKSQEIETKEAVIAQHKGEIETLEGRVEELQEQLKKSELEAFNLFGMNLTKGTYSTLLLSTIVILALLLSFYVFKFFESNVTTKAAQKSLNELQSKYEEHRAKAIEREQKLRRELQDEINKNKGSF